MSAGNSTFTTPSLSSTSKSSPRQPLLSPPIRPERGAPADASVSAVPTGPDTLSSSLSFPRFNTTSTQPLTPMSSVSSTPGIVLSSSTTPITTPSTPTTSSIVSTPGSSTPISSSTPSSSTAVLPSTPSSSSSSFTPSSTSISTVDSTTIVATSSVRGSSASPSSTQIITRTITETASNGRPTQHVTTVIVTQGPSSTPAPSATSTSAAASSSTAVAPQLQNPGGSNSNKGGLGTGGIAAIAVVVPVVSVAIIVALAIFLWRKRQQKKIAQEARRKEVEEYGYNPNTDPTLPAVGSTFGGADSPPAMSEAAGYRGWGTATTTTGSARKPSTNLSSAAAAGVGLAVSDDGRGHSPGSPPQHNSSDGGRSMDPLMEGSNDYHGIGAAATGATVAGVAGAGAVGAGAARNRGNNNGINRGPSNASSTYSAAGATEPSEDGRNTQDYGYDTNYSQYAPYRPGQANYGGESEPVIQDVSARRQTKLENPGVFPHQGNSGISQNF